MNSKAKNVAKKHKKRRRLLKEKSKGQKVPKSRKVLLTRFSALLRNDYLAIFKITLGGSWLREGVVLKEKDLYNGFSSVELRAKGIYADHLRCSFMDGMLRNWGEKFKEIVPGVC